MITVSFGESASGPRTLASGPGYSRRLAEEGWRKVRKYNHGLPWLGVVAVKYRWERDGERCFTSYRVIEDVPVPLWCSCEIAEADEVWLSESHSDAEALIAAGVVATTNWGAASDWNVDYARQLRGKQVILVRHRDPAGRAFAEAVCRTVSQVTVVEAATGNDARDHLEAGYGLDDFRAVRR